MRLFVLFLLISFQFTSFAQGQNDFINLFDGKSLNGWEHYLVEPDLEMEDVWKVEDGILICKGEPMGYLATKNQFTNYKLVIEWRWPEGAEPGNSGVLMRISGDPKALPKCAEAQLKHGSAGDIYGFHGFNIEGDTDRYLSREAALTGKLTGVTKIIDNENDPGEWNRYEIYLLKGNLTVYVNGLKVNEAHNLDLVEGKIGFQSEGGVVQFRTIKILPLDNHSDHAHSHTNHISVREWPQFHGPNRDNMSNESGLLKKWPEEGPELLWTCEGLGHGFSSVSIANDMIFTAGNIDGNTVVTAMDFTGKIIWQTNNGKSWEESYPGTRSTPTFDNGRVYHQSPLGNVVCLAAETGEVLWQKNVLKEFNSSTNKWALAESLLIDGDKLISTPGGPEVSMIAMDKITGDIVWKAESTGDLAGYSSPVLFEQDGLRILANLTAKNFIGVNADNGKLVWKVAHESYADENILMPIYKDGEIFVSTLQTGSVKWKVIVNDGVVSLEEIWRSKDMDNHHGGVALLDGYLYGTSTFKNRDKWVCLDWNTGETIYVKDGTGKSSLTYVDGLLYTFSTNRLVGLVKPDSDEFEVISSFEIPKGGEGLSWAHPVVLDGRMYLRHGDYLYVYDIRNRQ